MQEEQSGTVFYLQHKWIKAILNVIIFQTNLWFPLLQTLNPGTSTVNQIMNHEQENNKFIRAVTENNCCVNIVPTPLANFKFSLIGGRGWGNSKITWGTLTWAWKTIRGMYVIPYIEFQGAQWFWNSLNSLNFTKLFW